MSRTVSRGRVARVRIESHNRAVRKVTLQKIVTRTPTQTELLNELPDDCHRGRIRAALDEIGDRAALNKAISAMTPQQLAQLDRTLRQAERVQAFNDLQLVKLELRQLARERRSWLGELRQVRALYGR